MMRHLRRHPQSSILHLQPNEPSLRTVVRELHIEVKLAGLQQLDYLLQRIAIFPTDPDKISIDGSLDLELRIFDDLDNFLRFLRGNSLLQVYLLAHGAIG